VKKEVRSQESGVRSQNAGGNPVLIKIRIFLPHSDS
jgi:hypothetical protein